MNKNTIIVTAVSVIAIVAFFVVSYAALNKPQEKAQVALPAQIAALKETDHLKWSKNKKILLIEYGDLQCPSCRSAHDLFKQIETSDKKEDKQIIAEVTIVWRHFPLPGHAHAQAAAHAAEAAAAQGKFFEYVELLFENQDEWAGTGNPQTMFEGFARDLKLDLAKFKSDMKSKTVKDRVEADRVGGLEAGVASTPSFFLNGSRLEAAGIDDLRRQLLEAASRN